MKYKTQDLNLGDDFQKKILIVTADRQITQEELPDIGSFLSGFCRASRISDAGVETWFIYPDEYDLQIKNWIAAYADIPTDPRERKLWEMGKACNAAIYAGIDVGGSHYSLTDHDQTEIMAQRQAVKEGAPAVPYHEDGGVLCRLFPADEFMTVADAAMAHIFYHRTYCNHLNNWIRREEDPDVLAAIAYGAQLPADLAGHMAEILAAVEAGA